MSSSFHMIFLKENQFSKIDFQSITNDYLMQHKRILDIKFNKEACQFSISIALPEDFAGFLPAACLLCESAAVLEAIRRNVSAAEFLFTSTREMSHLKEAPPVRCRLLYILHNV